MHDDAITESNKLSDAEREIRRSSFDKSENGAGNQAEVRAVAGNAPGKSMKGNCVLLFTLILIFILSSVVMQIASIKALCASFKALMDAKENDIFTEWCQKVVEVSKLHLSKSLLTVHEDRQLDVNFDPELTGLLRETRYLIIMKRLELPKEATRLYYRTQFFFESTYNLSLLVQW